MVGSRLSRAVVLIAIGASIQVGAARAQRVPCALPGLDAWNPALRPDGDSEESGLLPWAESGDLRAAPPASETAGAFRVVKVFDFDERTRGNFEDIPLHWHRVHGAGLPTYAEARLDDEIGHKAAPSFRLAAPTGHVAFEYTRLDIPVACGSEYEVTAQVRAEAVEHSAAFIHAFLVDRFGEPIEASGRISNLVRSTGASPEPWQTARLTIHAAAPQSFSICLRLWLAQEVAWQRSGIEAVDPIRRTDVHAVAWFDDVQIRRVPNATLRLSTDAPVLVEGDDADPAHLLVELSRGDEPHMNLRLALEPVGGGPRRPVQLAPMEGSGPRRAATETPHGPLGSDEALESHLHARLPDLPAGLYTAVLEIEAGEAPLLTRRLRLGVLPRLDAGPSLQRDIGVNLGAWRASRIAEVRELLTALGAGSVKIGVPMMGVPDTKQEADSLRQMTGLVRELAQRRIESIGVVLGPDRSVDPNEGLPLSPLIRDDGVWIALFSPVLAHFGGLIPTWQLGPEGPESRGGGWSRARVEQVRRLVQRYMTLPQLVQPDALLGARSPEHEPAGAEIRSVQVPALVPPRALPAALRFLALPADVRTWLTLAPLDARRYSQRARAADLAQRLALAKAFGPEKLHVPAPFELSEQSGLATWEPTEDFIPLRTLMRVLSGKRARAVLRPRDGTIAILFADLYESVLVLWSWRDAADAAPVRLFLGSAPEALDLNARPIPLATRDGWTEVPVGPDPRFVRNIRPELMLLASGYRFEPRQVEDAPLREPPTVHIENPFAQPMSGELLISPPESWRVHPLRHLFELPPGGRLSLPLDVHLPPRTLATTTVMTIRLIVQSPEAVQLDFQEQVEVGLRNIVHAVHVQWEGDSLRVEQTLGNESDATVNFSAFCAPSGQARLEGAFLRVASGASARQVYLIPDARSLAGSKLFVGIEEIGGRRRLNQLVEVPR